MPEASTELRNKMIDRFGNIDDGGPCEFLLKSGYKLTRAWQWKPKTGVVTCKDMTQEEFDCMRFLMEEWDYGGLEVGESNEG